MALDDLAAKKKLLIDPSSKYDRKTFVGIADMLFGDLEADRNRLRQNINDRDALDDLMGDIAPYTSGDQQTLWEENPHLALNRADHLYSSAYDSMALFVESNRDELLDKLDEKQLNELLMSSPLYVTGNKEYDEFRNLKEKASKIQSAKKEGKTSEVVNQELQKLLKKMSKDERDYTERNQHLVIPTLMESIGDSIENDLNNAFAKLFVGKDKKLNPKAIKDYLIANYEAVEDKMNDAPYDNQKKKLYYDNLRHDYARIAKILLGPEKKDQKWEDDPEKERFKKECRDAGMKI